MNVYPYDAGAAEFDVIIIGAGINGSAIARDCAMRGLRTVVVDKGDIGAGTTSKSTRLIHGGLRYLEHFEVPLVRESLHERGSLLPNAPHLVQVLHFLLPVYAEGSHRESVIRLGMLAYEVLSLGDHGPEHHQMLSPEEPCGSPPAWPQKACAAAPSTRTPRQCTQNGLRWRMPYLRASTAPWS